MKISQKILQSALLLVALFVTSIAQPMQRKLDAQEKSKNPKTTLILKRRDTQPVTKSPVNQQQSVVEQSPQTIDEITEDQVADIINSIPIVPLNHAQDYQPPYDDSFFNQTLALEENYTSQNPLTLINQFNADTQDSVISNFVSNEYGYDDQDSNTLMLYRDDNSSGNNDTSDSSSIKLYGNDVIADQAIKIPLTAASHAGTILFLLDDDIGDFYNQPIPFGNITHATIGHIVNCLNSIHIAFDNNDACNLLAKYINTLNPQAINDLLDAANYFDIPLLRDVIECFQTIQAPQEEDEEENEDDEESKEESHENRLKCKTCGKIFTQTGSLNRHQIKHTGEKRFKCEICGQAFIQKSDLTRHQKVHTSEKSFTCEICGKSFTRKDDVARHQKVHTREKPFQCKTCGQGFTQKCSLNKHITLHTGENAFPCEYCDAPFAKKYSLTKHINEIHSEQIIAKNRSKKRKR